MKKKIWLLALTVCLLLTLTPLAASATDITAVDIFYDAPQAGVKLDDYIEVAFTPALDEKDYFVIAQWNYEGDDGQWVDIPYEDLDTYVCQAGKTYHLHLGLVLPEGYQFTGTRNGVTLNGKAAPADVSIWFPEDEDNSVMCVDQDFGPLKTTENPFTDVTAGKYYYDPVLWALSAGITEGTSATTFSPAQDCNRAQVVTFLWRAMGEPAATATTCPFTDVSETAYYYDAVLWAVEKGVTKGISDTSFAPGKTVTRGQFVTFLWRAAGSPAVTGNSPFTDVPAADSGAYYYNAVLWAARNDITGGLTPTTFGPGQNCNRGQVVTFLYRCFN